ncbi:MAG: 4'-phosphopantetheinyl transferase family protein [Candidatus Coproplasma sp.]
MFKLSYIDVTQLSDGAFERMCAVLPAERLERVQAQSFKEDKLLYAAAGFLLYTALKDVGLVNPQICRGEHGKPYLKEGGVFFNLSHSGAVAVCAISDEEVGVDVQQVRPVKDVLIRRVCTKEEYSFVTENGGDIYERFCRVWAVKESVLKCLGAGLSLSPSRIEVKLSSPPCISIDGAGSRLHVKEHTLNGYRIAVCGTADNFSPDINKMTV